jgi:hypothetical protein
MSGLGQRVADFAGALPCFAGDRLDHSERLLFTAMTRATVRLEIVLREGNSVAERLMSV